MIDGLKDFGLWLVGMAVLFGITALIALGYKAATGHDMNANTCAPGYSWVDFDTYTGYPAGECEPDTP